MAKKKSADQLRAEIKSHGDRRREALATAKQELEAIEPLIEPALEAGISIVEIQRLGAVSRPTIYAKKKS